MIKFDYVTRKNITEHDPDCSKTSDLTYSIL